MIAKMPLAREFPASFLKNITLRSETWFGNYVQVHGVRSHAGKAAQGIRE
jgi:hypothetical protein